jgi:MATE family multidrug resistance protein
VAYPLVLGHMSFTLQTFLDRVFLTWYSPDAVAGAITGLFITWALISLFLATGEYTGTFVAQYHGAQRPERIGPALWQGIYFAGLAGVLIAGVSPFAGAIFDRAGHDPRVRGYEVEFASLLMRGAFPVVLMGTLSSFFAGRSETLTVLRVNILATLTNVVLDYAWIFGNLGFPRAGVRGAALATITAQSLGCFVYLWLILRKDTRRRYATLSGWRFDPALFGRLLRFGFPSGLQVSLEILAFALFLVLVGRLGTVELAATGLAFNLNGVVWVPMVGLGLGVSSIVGRYQGAGRPELAERTTYSAIVIALAYMSVCSSLYFLAPSYLLAPYRAGADAALFPALERLASVLLRFVAVYSVFDMVSLMCASGLRGAGDTAFAMRATIGIGFLAMLLPTYLACTFLGGGIYTAWCFASLYPFLLGTLLLRRFRAGGWKELRVIEPAPLPGPAASN